MTATSKSHPSTSYPASTIERAELAVRCGPFLLPLFVTMRSQGVSLRTIAGSAGVTHQYSQISLSELAADAALNWLIQVGLLRREVDGQGLTDSFRLTPLGRQLVSRWEMTGFPSEPRLTDRLKNAVNRWLRSPDWLQ